MDQKVIIGHGIRSINHHIHRIDGDTPSRGRSNAAPCSSCLPFEPSTRRKSCANVDNRATSSRYLPCDKPFLPDSTKDNRRNYTRMNPDAFRLAKEKLEPIKGLFKVTKWVEERGLK